VTDYSSSSEESESSDEEEEDGESETHDGTVAVSDIPRLIPTGAPGSTEQYNVGMVGTHGLETSHTDTFSSSISREGTLMIREVSWYKNCAEEVHFLSGFDIRAFTENAYGV